MKNPALVLVVVASIGFGSADAQTDCSLRKDSNGIKVYSCNVEGAKVKGVKAIFELDAAFEQVASVVFDVPFYTLWQYRMINARLVDKGKDELTYYAEISAPWPVSNRDMIVNLKFEYDPAAKVLEIIGNGRADQLPTLEDVVRIPYFKAKWKMQEIAKGKLHVEYTLDVDIGGAIPAWLVNMAQAEGPFETFGNLKERLKLEQYKGGDYSFLNE